MTLDRPLLLLALLALPILYLLARNLRLRRPVTVPSLLIWSRLNLAADPPRDLARRADRLLLLRLLVAGIVAFGLSGPRLAPGAPDPVVDVLIDNSPSMSAFDDGVERALDRVREHAPSGADLRITRAPVRSGLAAVLSERGGGDVVLVTDRVPPGLGGEGGGRIFFTTYLVLYVGNVIY